MIGPSQAQSSSHRGHLHVHGTPNPVTDPWIQAKAYPDEELHLVMDNYAAHKRVEVRDWLDANPRLHVHFTPTSGSWLNLVEVWFGIIERQAIRRGTFGSVKELNAKIRAFIDGWNDRCNPFVWTKTADEIVKTANRQQTSETDH
jgi:transposase